MDKIIITELQIETIIGCLAWERQVKQLVRFDIQLDYDLSSAGLSDDLHKTIDYNEIVKTVIDFVENSRFKLIEALAAQTAQLILEKFPFSSINLTLTKFAAVPHTKTISVNVQRP